MKLIQRRLFMLHSRPHWVSKRCNIMAWYSGAILINLLGGIIYDPQTGEYHNKESAIIAAENVFKEFEELKFEEWKLTEFEDWL